MMFISNIKTVILNEVRLKNLVGTCALVCGDSSPIITPIIRYDAI